MVDKKEVAEILKLLEVKRDLIMVDAVINLNRLIPSGEWVPGKGAWNTLHDIVSGSVATGMKTALEYKALKNLLGGNDGTANADKEGKNR